MMGTKAATPNLNLDQIHPMKLIGAYNSITTLFFVRGLGFVGDNSSVATRLDSEEAATVRATFANVRTTLIA